MLQTSALMVASVLVACVPKTQDRPDGLTNDAGNFAVVTMGGEIGGSRNVGEFPLPGEKIYNYKACLVDYSRRTNIPNGRFLVQELEQEYTTDANGCLNWPETVKYNYLADSVWLKQTRTLVGRGLQRGSRQVIFAINPWQHGESGKDVKDLAKERTLDLQMIDDPNEVKNRLAGLDKDGKKKTRRIWVDGGNRNVTNYKMEKGPVYTWHDQITIRPQISFGKVDGTPVPVPLANGVFKAEVSLILEKVKNQKIVRVPWAQAVKDKVFMTNNMLLIDMDFKIKKTPTHGQTFLGLKLIPIGAPEGLLPFEGIFPLGNSHSFTQSASLSVSETVASENRTGQFTIHGFLGLQKETPVQIWHGVSGSEGATDGLTQAESDEDDQSEKAGVFLDLLHVGEFKIRNETGSKITYSYPLGTCLKSRDSELGLAKANFRIETTLVDGGKVLDVKTQNVVKSETTACLHWQALTPEVDRWSCKHYFQASVRIVNEDLGVDVSQKFRINPWTQKGHDEREVKDEESYRLSCVSENADKSQNYRNVDGFINLDSLLLQKIEYRPQVLDRSLQVSQRGVYAIKLSGNMGVKSYSDEHSGKAAGNEYLQDGLYLLRLAFVRNANTRPDNGYVAHADVIMNASSNVLSGKMEITIRDLQASMARKTVLAQLFPLDMKKVGSKILKNNDPDIEQYIEKGKLISPIYSAETVLLGAETRAISLKQGIPGQVTLPEMVERGLTRKDLESNETLLKEIIRLGEFAQAEMIRQNAFKETDGKAWLAWSSRQNLRLTWLSNEKSVAELKSEFQLPGDAKATLQALVNMDRVDRTWGLHFCRLLKDHFWKDLIATDSSSSSSILAKFDSAKASGFMTICQGIVEKNPSDLIQKSAVYRILKMKPGILRPSTTPVSGLSVSSGFGYSSGHTVIEGTQGGLTLSGNLGASGGKGLFSGSAGLGLSYGPVRMVTDDHNRHSGSDAGTSLSLSVNKWRFDIPVTSFQRCTMLRLNPQVFLYDQQKTGFSLMKPWTWNQKKEGARMLVNYSDIFRVNQAPNPLLRGWLICSDQAENRSENQPLIVPENYYLVSQGNGDSESFDSFDEINREFFLPLRGNSDMARFKATMIESREYPKNGEMDDETRNDLHSQIEPLIRRLDPAPGLIMFDPLFEQLRSVHQEK